MALDERAFFSDRNESRPARYTCTRCHRTNEYTVRWVRRVKKDRMPGGADELDRAKFAKLRDHLIRVDDELVCKTCGRKFEIPSLQSLQFVDQLEGLPRDVEEDDEPVPGNDAAPAPVPGRPPPPQGQPHRPQPDRAQSNRPQAERSQADRPRADRPVRQEPAPTAPANDQRGNIERRGPRRITSPPRGWRG